MKQSELGIRMATVGLCGLRFWARFPTETYRCPALLQMAFSFNRYPGLGDRSNGQSESSEKKEEVNASIPAMVLRSEGERLSVNKKQEEGSISLVSKCTEILRLNRMIENQNKEVNLQVEKLMDLCLNQREEIKSLMSSFPDDTNSQLQELVEKQGSELKEVKQQVIPSLQQQVSSLTSQLQSLAVDLAEVKAPPHGREDASNSWNIGNQGGQENKKGKMDWQ